MPEGDNLQHGATFFFGGEPKRVEVGLEGGSVWEEDWVLGDGDDALAEGGAVGFCEAEGVDFYGGGGGRNRVEEAEEEEEEGGFAAGDVSSLSRLETSRGGKGGRTCRFYRRWPPSGLEGYQCSDL